MYNVTSMEWCSKSVASISSTVFEEMIYLNTFCVLGMKS